MNILILRHIMFYSSVRLSFTFHSFLWEVIHPPNSISPYFISLGITVVILKGFRKYHLLFFPLIYTEYFIDTFCLYKISQGPLFPIIFVYAEVNYMLILFKSGLGIDMFHFHRDIAQIFDFLAWSGSVR